ncbi:MAG: DUF1569 domain-containing protein [Pirellulaceae bacterium]
MSVNTAKAHRRELHFQSLDEVVAEAERLVGSDQVVTSGNWTLGQILYHLAQAIHMSIDGADFPTAWYVRLFGKLLKKRILRGMPAGFKLPKRAQQQLQGKPDTDAQEALESLRKAVGRMHDDPHRAPHPVFGAMTIDQWNQLHLRHAELHLSFADTAK